MATKRLEVQITGNSRDAEKAMGRVEGRAGKMGSNLAKVGGAMAGAFAAAGAISVFGSFIEEARESEKVARITANAVRVTGGAAGLTATQVGKLSEALAVKTGIDDEVIQTGANLLLTFKNIRDEAGKGNDVFTRAAAAATDLSIQFGSVDGASKMLGKALNDPIKGIAALSRAGVTFSAQQKEQIKVLQESGDVLGAQKIILAEVESQVGGAAEAAADPMKKLGVVVGNLKEQMGMALLPVISRAADWLGGALPGALDAARNAFAGVKQFLSPFRDDAERLADTIRVRLGEAFTWIAGTAIPWLKNAWADLAAAFQSGAGDGVFGTIGEQARTVFDWITGTALPGIQAAVESLMAGIRGQGGEGSFFTDLGEAAVTLAGWFQNTLLPAAQRLFNWLTNEGKPVLIAVGIAFAAIVAPVATAVAAFVYAYQRFEWFRNGVAFVLGAIRSYFVNIWAPAFAFAWNTASTVISRVIEHFQTIAPFFLGVFNLFRNYIENIWLPGFKFIWNIVSTYLGLVWDYITNVLVPVISRIFAVASTVFTQVAAVVTWWWTTAVLPVLNAVVGFVADTLIPKFQAIQWASAIVWNAVSSAVSTAWDFIKPKFDAIVSFIDTTLVPIWSKISWAVGAAFKAVPDLIGSALRKAGGIVSGFLLKAGAIAHTLGLGSIGESLANAAKDAAGWGQQTSGPNFYGFARGGKVFGGEPGKDSVPAMLMPGEVVIRKSSVDKYGVKNLLDLNEGKIPGFANGGALLKGAKYLMSQGARISEHPMFGGVGGGHAPGGYHYSNASGTGGDAFDANYGPGGQSSREMAFFDRMVGPLRDMGLRVLWRVKDHFNHLHADIGSGGGGGGGGVSGVYDALSGALRDLAAGSLERAWPALPGQKGLLGLIPGGVNKLRGGAIDLIKGQAGSIGGMGGAASGGAARAIVQRLAAGRGWVGAQWNALDRLVQKESSWNPNAANPTSSARGLFQKMTSIHGPLEPTIEGQANWGFNYISGRYGNPVNALAFHDRNNWYGGGGQVALHRNSFDVGGTLARGYNLVRNNTGRPEHLVPAGRGGQTIVNVYVEGSVTSERDLIDVVADGLNRKQRNSPTPVLPGVSG